MSSSSKALDLVRDLLSALNQDAPILASIETAEFFRKGAKKKAREPLAIPRGIEELGIGQGGSSNSLVETRDIVKDKARCENEKYEAKPTPHQNQFLSHERYISPTIPCIKPSQEPSEIAPAPPINLSPTQVEEKKVPSIQKLSDTKKTELNKISDSSEASSFSPKPSETHSSTHLSTNSSTHLFIRSAFQKAAPGFPILDEIPSDAIAKKIAERWKTKNQTAPISVLSLNEPEPQKKLLEEIAKALDVYFGTARLIAAEPIENDKQWEAFLSSKELKFIVVCDYTLWQLRDLMRHYKEVATQGERTLKNIPVFLLPDLSLYLKDPLLKKSLWKALCQKICL